MKTITQECDNYLRKVYSYGMTDQQENQLRQSFYVGAAIGLNTVIKMGQEDISEDDKADKLNEIMRELRGHLEGRIAEINRNRN